MALPLILFALLVGCAAVGIGLRYGSPSLPDTAPRDACKRTIGARLHAFAHYATHVTSFPPPADFELRQSAAADLRALLTATAAIDSAQPNFDTMFDLLMQHLFDATGCRALLESQPLGVQLERAALERQFAYVLSLRKNFVTPRERMLSAHENVTN